MVYNTVSEIKDRIVNYDGKDFYEINPDDNFDTLLETLEEETRELIENAMGNQTFEYETDRVDEILAPDNTAISLPRPIQDITKVEYKRFLGDTWTELDTDRYTYTQHHLVLQSFPKLYRGRFYNQTIPSAIGLKQYSNKITWNDFAQKLKITYDRGYETVPQNVKNIQIDLITKILRRMRNEQSISAIQPDEIQNAIDFDTLMTEEIRDRLKDISSFGHTVVAI